MNIHCMNTDHFVLSGSRCLESLNVHLSTLTARVLVCLVTIYALNESIFFGELTELII